MYTSRVSRLESLGTAIKLLSESRIICTTIYDDNLHILNVVKQFMQ